MAQLPIVHMNGTGKPALLKANRLSAQATRCAIQAWSAGMPHGRDYYPAGDEAYSKAREEYVNHIRNLQAALAYLDEIAERALI